MFPRVKGKKKTKNPEISVWILLKRLKWGYFWFTWFECKED